MMAKSFKLKSAVTGQREELVLVPRKPTREMIEAAWADALAEDSAGMWETTIRAYESSVGNSFSGNG